MTGQIVVDGGADITLSRVGQDARHTFEAIAGDSLGLDLSGISVLPQAQSVSPGLTASAWIRPEA